jgi:protein-disulfide isomerase
MMLTLAGALVGAALWFCYLQLFVLHAFCKYCTLLHLLGCVLAGFILVAGRTLSLSKGRYGWFAAGLVSAALFAFVQSRTLQAAAYDTGRTEVALPAFTDGEIPVLGPSDAPDELTLLFDFQCVHCRRLHKVLPELLAKAGGQYRIRLCPVPLSSACNPYIPASGIDRFAGSCQLTRFALAVWYARPDVYEAYWDYLLGGGNERASIAPADAEARARALLGDGFQEAVQDPRIDAYLRKAEELFGRTSNAEKSGVPRLIHGQKWLVPETDQADELLELIRLSL